MRDGFAKYLVVLQMDYYLFIMRLYDWIIIQWPKMETDDLALTISTNTINDHLNHWFQFLKWCSSEDTSGITSNLQQLRFINSFTNTKGIYKDTFIFQCLRGFIKRGGWTSVCCLLSICDDQGNLVDKNQYSCVRIINFKQDLRGSKRKQYQRFRSIFCIMEYHKLCNKYLPIIGNWVAMEI